MKKHFGIKPDLFPLLLIFLAALSITIYSCRDQLSNSDTPPPAPGQTFQEQSQSISYEEFLSDMKRWKDQTYFNHFRAAATNRTSEKRLFYWEPKPSQRDSVRRISINGHTTYTIVLEPMSRSTPVFHNLVIDSTAEGVNTLVMTYIPDDKWVDEYRRDRRRDFYGKVIANDYMELPNERTNGRTNYKPVCTSVMVLSQIVEHLCCHNMQAHNGCNCPAGQQYNIQFMYSEVTTCIDVDVPPIGGMPGGGGNGGGDGGGTVPYPGGGYDPCQLNALRTSTNPCNPPNPGPQSPVYVANANVQQLLNFAASKGVSFDNALVPMLNAQPQTNLDRIKELVAKFGPAVSMNIKQLHSAITGEELSIAENTLLDALGDNYYVGTYMIRLIYAANAFAAQSATVIKYNLCSSICSSCKGNAFKHALFLIYNANVFGFSTATSLAAAHESEMIGKETEMDKINNAAGAKIYQKFSGAGSPLDWINRVFSSTTSGEFGMTFLVVDVFKSTKSNDGTECL